MRPTRQDTDCGAACLRACGLYWCGPGTPWPRERNLYPLLQIGRDGAEASSLAKVARSAGLRAGVRFGATVDNLRAWLAHGVTTIVGIQAWPAKTPRSWARRWKDGHYVAIVAIDDAHVYTMDPSTDWRHAYLPIAEFEERWHLVTDGDERQRPAIPICGVKPAWPLGLERLR